MNRFERRLAELLRNVSDEPLRTVDADAILARRRYVAPIVAVAVVLTVAIVSAVVLGSRSRTAPAAAAHRRPTGVASAAGLNFSTSAVTPMAQGRHPSKTRVPSSVTWVDVLVVRKNPQLHQGAPTVQRSLSGRALRTLAGKVNVLPRAKPGIDSCPADFVGEQWRDVLVFRSPHSTVRVLVNLVACEWTKLTPAHGPAIRLGGNLDTALMRVLGLPADYGGR